MSHDNQSNCGYCHGTGWKKDGFGGEIPCAGESSVEQPSTPPPPKTSDAVEILHKRYATTPERLASLNEERAALSQPSEAQPVQPWRKRFEVELTMNLMNRVLGVHAVDLDAIRQQIRITLANYDAAYAPSSSASREETHGVICAEWTMLGDGCVARCDRAHRHEGKHLDSLIAIEWEKSKRSSSAAPDRAYLTALRIMLEDKRDAALNAVREDYPEMAEIIDQFSSSASILLEDLIKQLTPYAKKDCRDCGGTGMFYGNVGVCSCVLEPSSAIEYESAEDYGIRAIGKGDRALWIVFRSTATIDQWIYFANRYAAERQPKRRDRMSDQEDFVAKETAKALGWKIDKDGFLIHSCGRDEERAQNIWNAEYDRQKSKVRRG